MTRQRACALAIAALIVVAAVPAAAQPAQTWLACSYFDFNHDLSYRSRTFAVPLKLSSVDDLSTYSRQFETAVKAQYKVWVDPRHVECHTVGEWRVPAETARQRYLEADPSLLPADERLVSWPQ